MVIEIIPNWHPIFVHFTIALLSISTLLFVIGTLAPAMAKWKESCLIVARWNLWIGVIITIGTILAGWYAYNTVQHTAISHAAMTDHRNWALSTAAIFVALAIWSLLSRNKEPSKLFVTAIIGASILLAITGYKGGELVYRHGTGVIMAVPASEEKDHNQGQNDGHSHEHGDHHH